MKYESLKIISTDSLLTHEKDIVPQVNLYNCAFEIVNTQIKDYVDNNLFNFDRN